MLKKLLDEMKQHQEKSYKIIALGSSNTELSWHSGGRHNWVDWLNISLRTHVGKNVNTINQGICGDRSDQILARLERDVFSYNPSIAIITGGGNDICQRYPISHYIANTKSMIEQLLAKDIYPVLQTYYCPIYSDAEDFLEAPFIDFVEENRSLASEYDLPLIDQYAVFEPLYRKSVSEYRRIMTDCMHVNYLGNLLMGKVANQVFGMPDFDVPADINHAWNDLKYRFSKNIIY